MRRWLLPAACLAVVAVGGPSLPSSAAPEEEVAPLCRLVDERIEEASGLAAASGLWWTHDDSAGGGPARLYGLDRSCRTVVVLQLAGTAPVDAEDLGVGPGDGGRPALWLADTGDNRARRPGVTLVRVVVPDVDAQTGGGDAPALEAPVQEYPMVYADGARDAEAILVDPAGDPLVVTKPLLGRPGVYGPSARLVPGVAGVLERVGDVRLGRAARPSGSRAVGPAGPLSPSLVTGGAVSRDGAGVVLLTYTDAHVWWTGPAERADGVLDVPALLGRAPDAVLPLPPLEQAEAVAWGEDGRSLLVTGEGSGAPVHRLALDPPREGPAGARVAVPGVGEPPGSSPGAPGAGVTSTATVPPRAGAGAGDAGEQSTGRARTWTTVVVLGVAGWSVWAVLRSRRAARLARRTGG